VLPGLLGRYRDPTPKYEGDRIKIMIEPGDFVKAEFRSEATGESEWMWVKVEHAAEEERIFFGTLDGEPMVNPELHLGMKLAVSYDNIREHLKSSAFNQ